MGRLCKFAIAVVALAASVGAIAAALLNFWPSFGGTVAGDRAVRAQASPQFRNGHFENVIPQTPKSNALLWDYFKRQVRGQEVRTPPPPCPPVVRLRPEDFRHPPAPGLRAIWFGHASVYWKSTACA